MGAPFGQKRQSREATSEGAPGCFAYEVIGESFFREKEVIWPVSGGTFLGCIKGIVGRQYIDTARTVVNDGELLGTILNIG